MMRRTLAGTACGAFALGGAVAMVAPGVWAASPAPAAATAVTVVQCGPPGATTPPVMGSEDLTVALSTTTAAPGDTVTATVTEGPGPVMSTLTKPGVPTTAELDLVMSGGATGTVTVTGAPTNVDLVQGQAVIPPTFTGTFTVPADATGTVTFSPLRTLTSTNLGGYTAVNDCEVTGAVPAIAYLSVNGGSPATSSPSSGPTPAQPAATGSPTSTPTPPAGPTAPATGAGTPPPAQQLSQGVAADLPPQGLSMTQAGTGIDFGAVTMNGSAQTLKANLNEVTVTDARGGNLGWTLTGELSDLKAATGTSTIPAADVSWAPQCVAAPSSASAVTPGSAGALSSSAPVVLCSQAADSAHTTGGQFTADAALTLTTPEFAAAGAYTGTLTLSLS